MRLVLVHGRDQAGKHVETLRSEWIKALNVGLGRAQLPPISPFVDVRLPFYGDRLEALTNAPRVAGAVLARGPTAAGSRFAADFVLELADRADVTDAEIIAALDEANPRRDCAVGEKGPQNWPWVLAAGRAISAKCPWLSDELLSLLTADVEAYLTRLTVRDSINAIVEHELDEPAVVVGHSLGSVVAYSVLKGIGARNHCPLLVTLGSPLGIDAVKRHLARPFRRPNSVAAWLNGSDVRDHVALFPRLDRDVFGDDVENLSDIHNPRDDPHGIAGYLSDPVIARRIIQALSQYV